MTNAIRRNSKITCLSGRRTSLVKYVLKAERFGSALEEEQANRKSVAIIARPDNRQDLPLPINFAHLPVLDARIRNLVVDDEIVIECHQPQKTVLANLDVVKFLFDFVLRRSEEFSNSI